ncbi:MULTISPECIES: PTS sugar transporter subunit IIB [unclassified Breznakia]|uniref:PTS sugar transporter subunit IIB n=1 Tax=unclassified Breznakia TaxID=2623764 RepID=UPI0024746F5A|nr:MULTISPECIES: PTS sugar transporter subunit IIB [unclassified Breznakia]MDH6366559.1 PTS system cellobiose-specific IIB component [Breznakia sp. PH1-1]MDH6403652.1 PTS system cellobiose-specific IIB component [Breznakia sp. PF1-11]MDH6411361.1 PTS system cellobiose-specific IIB component [Breznakia sp. PFB1-11]MDH6413663.1 PTS system cellobiose-specific IIB component [Breznakia sp. PFB1-14]MDH6415906.1 PTS system cellobiose-specific IIB component [Breznakia sp. PFB1-4]
MKNILLVCGSGASSGFLARNIRVAAKNRGIEVKVTARSDAAVEDYLDTLDLLLVAPHLDYLVSELEKTASARNVPVHVIPKAAYGSLNGEAVLDFILDETSVFKNEEE